MTRQNLPEMHLDDAAATSDDELLDRQSDRLFARHRQADDRHNHRRAAVLESLARADGHHAVAVRSRLAGKIAHAPGAEALSERAIHRARILASRPSVPLTFDELMKLA